MRTLLRWVATRYGVVGILVLGVVVTVGLARLAGGEADRPGSAAPGEDPYANVSMGPDDGVYHPTTDPNSPPPEQRPKLPAGLADPRPVADRFAKAWADHDGVAPKTWHDTLARYSSKSLMERLAGTDPAAVPTDGITGGPRLVSVIGRSRASVTLEAKGGLLVLGLVHIDHRWAVDSIDWRRG